MSDKKQENLIPLSAGQVSRPPVVVVLGHIDHGKTSLLNNIRSLQFTGEKPGGVITQHIGAYEIEKDGKKITFLDTPGHEAFSAMRGRGAKIADIAILVIDAGEGVQPQTKEAISHIKKSGVSLIIALNKMDKPNANPEKAKGELAKEDILVESMGGEILSVNVSAKTGQGIGDLLDLISLVAEMEELKADTSKPAEGVIIESFLDVQRGPMASLLLQKGILRLGDIVGTQSVSGKIKFLENSKKEPIKEVLPAMPAIVLGFESVPKVGEIFKVFPDMEKAKTYLKIEEKKLTPKTSQINKTLAEADKNILNLILKTDVLGSVEAIEGILKEIPQGKVALNILKSEAGEISESDIKLAKGSRAFILGFRTKINSAAKSMSEREKIKIMNFEIIYDLVEEVRKFMEKIMKPEIVRKDLAKVRVLANFLTEKNRQIIGGRVVEGEVKKGVSIEVFRQDELLGRGRLINLQRNKKDIDKASKGDECGMLFEGDIKVQEGDILVMYIEEREKAGL